MMAMIVNAMIEPVIVVLVASLFRRCCPVEEVDVLVDAAVLVDDAVFAIVNCFSSAIRYCVNSKNSKYKCGINHAMIHDIAIDTLISYPKVVVVVVVSSSSKAFVVKSYSVALEAVKSYSMVIFLCRC